MAVNWEKLKKLQRDFPKPKFAYKEITRQTKKQPTNPYLWAWKADVSLQLGTPGKTVVRDNLQPILERTPPITDARLLAYVYNVFLEALRSHDPATLGLSSAGTEVLKALERAAKALQTRNAKLDFWSEFFVCALREDCWEDVRFTLNQALKEGTKSKKTVSFTMILANQLVYQREAQRFEGVKQPNKIAMIQSQIAHGKMKQAFEAASKSPNDPIKVETMRDLRFMAQIFRLQNRHDELFNLWDNAAPALKEKLDENYVEVALLKLDYLKEQNAWGRLYDQAIKYIEAALDEKRSNQDPQIGVSVRSWRLWSGLFEAESRWQLDPDQKENLRKTVASYLVRVPLKGREIYLTRIAWAADKNRQDLLGLCKQYWQDYCHLNSCFQDLCHFVEGMSFEDQQDFHQFINLEAMRKERKSENADEEMAKKWLQAEVNVLKFSYMLTIAMPKSSELKGVEAYVNNAIRLYRIGALIKDDCYQDAGILAIAGLLALHQRVVHRAWTPKDPLRMRQGNTRLLLQAGFLARHLTASDAGKRNRRLLLFSTRLHLHLGLGTIAFAEYSQARVKEILQDTLSYVFLTRISQIHPFDAKGPKGFSPDAELANVIGTIQKMASRVDDFLYMDMQDFLYDQTIELLEFKRTLKTSLSKHLCLIERRRIARLKGETVDSTFDLPMEDYNFISDNRDFPAVSIFWRESTLAGEGPLIKFANSYQPLEWLYERHEYEETCRLVFKESRDTRIQERLTQNRKVRDCHQSNPMHIVEDSLRYVWIYARVIADEVLAEPPKEILVSEKGFISLFEEVLSIEDQLKELLVPSTTPLKPADELLMPLENGLMYSFGRLELLQLLWKLCDATMEILKKKDNRLKGKISTTIVEACASQIEDTYNMVRKLAQSFIFALKTRGFESILAQVQWGPTGVALNELISEDEQRSYAKEYVDSAIESAEGILQVKLK